MTATSTKPGATNAGNRMLVSDWKAYSKNTLMGFFSLSLPSGLIIRNCSLHQKGESRWIGLPSQKYVNDAGVASFAPLIEFSSKDAKYRFQDSALAAVDEYFSVVPSEAWRPKSDLDHRFVDASREDR